MCKIADISGTLSGRTIPTVLGATEMSSIILGKALRRTCGVQACASMCHWDVKGGSGSKNQKARRGAMKRGMGVLIEFDCLGGGHLKM